MEEVIFAERLFDGSGCGPRVNQGVVIDDGLIVRFCGLDETLPCLGRVASLTPGLIDLQINGAADCQFNASPTVASLSTIAKGAAQGGTTGLMPTFITDEGCAYQGAVDAVIAARSQGMSELLGVHLEGPFLSQERPGVHPRVYIRAMDDDDVAFLIDRAQHLPIMLTVAPECQSEDRLAALLRAGVLLFAGHSAADAQTMARAHRLGFRGVTHLFNAMGEIRGREPSIPGYTLATGDLYAGIIADGHHVDRLNIKLAARAMPDHLCLVTDAMMTLAGRRVGFDLFGRQVRLEGGKLTDEDGRLAGAHISMSESLDFCVEQVKLPRAQAVRMATRNPAAALGLENDLGLIAPGFRASFTLFDSAWQVVSIVVDGEYRAVTRGIS